MNTSWFTTELLLFILLNGSQSYGSILPASRDGRTLDIFNILPDSRRTLGFLPGTVVSLKWLLSFPLTTITRIRTAIEFTHLVPMRLGVLYPEIEDVVPLANPFTRPGRRSGLAAEHYIDNEVAHELKFLGYGDLMKKGIFTLDLQNLTESQIMEAKFDKALKHDRLRARIERAYFYADFEALMGKMGMPGRPCMKRTICEVGSGPFEGSLLGEIINVLLTPSLGGQPEITGENLEYQEYIEAEKYGKSSGNCAVKYNECKTSVFSLIFDLMEDIFL